MSSYMELIFTFRQKSWVPMPGRPKIFYKPPPTTVQMNAHAMTKMKGEVAGGYDMTRTHEREKWGGRYYELVERRGETS